MLNALKNLFWSNKEKKRNSEEVIIPISHNGENKSPNATQMGNRGHVTIPGEMAWDNYLYTCKTIPEYDGVRDISRYNGRSIIGEIAEKIKKEAYKVPDNTIGFVDLEESKDENNIIHPTLRIALSENRPVCLRGLLDTDQCKEYDVNAVTLCHSDKDKTRGLRLRVDEKETRIYEVANGSYEMILKWYIKEQECMMKISISDDGFVIILDRNGVTNEQILAYREVKVGKQHEAKFLGEALGLQPAKSQTQMKNGEGVAALSQKAEKTQCPYPTTLAMDFVKKNPEVKSALKELGSELQKESSEVAKPSTSVTPPTKVEDVKKTQEKKQKDTAQAMSR